MDLFPWRCSIPPYSAAPERPCSCTDMCPTDSIEIISLSKCENYALSSSLMCYSLGNMRLLPIKRWRNSWHILGIELVRWIFLEHHDRSPSDRRVDEVFKCGKYFSNSFAKSGAKRRELCPISAVLDYMAVKFANYNWLQNVSLAATAESLCHRTRSRQSLKNFLFLLFVTTFQVGSTATIILQLDIRVKKVFGLLAFKERVKFYKYKPCEMASSKSHEC